VNIPAKSEFTHPTVHGHTVCAYVIGGQGYFDASKTKPIADDSVCLYEDGDYITVSTGGEPVRFLLISGKPIGEPVAWYGPIVMNTEEELGQAFEEYQNGTFIKHKKPQRT
jgi:quercetin 2,3-dioxygenase